MTEQEYQQYLKAQRNYSSARIEILFIIVLTFINMALVPISGRYFVCSITLATAFVTLAKAIRLYPSEFDIPEEAVGSMFLAAVVLAILLVVAYLVLFALSKKKKGCLIALLVLYSIDAFVSFSAVFSDPTLIVDIVIHAVSIYMLAKGVSSAKILQEHFAKGVNISAKEIRGYFEESQRQKADEAINRAKQPQFQDDDPFGYGTPAAQQTTVQQQANVIANCPACGAKRNGADKFCPYCGTAYEATETQQPTTTMEQPTTPPSPQNSSDDNSDSNEYLA